MIRICRPALLARALAATLSAGLVGLALPAAAQDTKHFKPGEAPSADEVARILGGCESADNCDGVRTRQIMVRKKGQAAPPSGFSVPVQFELGSASLTPDALSSLAGIAAGLAHGRPLEQAVSAALDFVARAIAQAPGLGGGHGPLNHFVRVPTE